MQTFSLGKVTVPTAGTRVNLGTLLPANFPADHKAARVIVSQISSTGNVVFGTAAVVASTLAGAIKQFLLPGTSGLRDSYVHEDGSSQGNSLHVDDYAIDVATNGDGLIISIEVR